MSFSYVCSTVALFAAWQKFKRGKRSRLDIQVYERHLEENIFELRQLLVSGQYRHSKYIPFTIHDPKQRQIHKATVQDRLVHQAITTAIEPLFERQFIYDSYSCRKGKGTHAAVKWLQRFLRRASANNTRTIYALKCDIRLFFASVDHDLLMTLLKRKIRAVQILGLLQEVIASFEVRRNKGIPLGNLTSQLFANVYLHELDWFIKQTLCEQYYIRYCDDFIVLSQSREHLLELIDPIKEFLLTRLGLSLHPNKIVLRSWRQGIDFLGYVLKPHGVVLRAKTKRRMLRLVDSTNLPSYLGLCSHADAYELKMVILNKVIRDDG